MKNSKTILIVDDSASIRELVGISLEDNGYSVIKGCDGKDGLDKLQENRNVDMIITDLNMPIMDGLTFLKEIRKHERYQYVPILILTTESNVNMRNEAKSLGATGWIIKPFEKDKLIKVIQKVMR